jgi:TM2 domain-containing membrane protein YozV
MKHSPFFAGILSVLIPGLGQIYGGQSFKGGMIIAAAIVIANLNIIILPLISMANPVIPAGSGDPTSVWAYWIPRIVHDVASVWSIAFWVWAVVDAVITVKKSRL